MQSAQNDAPIILLLYVDDILLFSPSANRVTTIKYLLRAKYKMTDLGPVRCFLGIEIECDRSRRILHIHQQRAVQKLLAVGGGFWASWTPRLEWLAWPLAWLLEFVGLSRCLP